MTPSTNPARDARLLAELDDETTRLLFPERFTEPLRVTLVYPTLDEANNAKAKKLLRDAEHSVDEHGDHHATFTLAQLEPLHAMYALLEQQSVQLRVLLDDKTVPMVRELWLPLLWTLRAAHEAAE